MPKVPRYPGLLALYILTIVTYRSRYEYYKMYSCPNVDNGGCLVVKDYSLYSGERQTGVTLDEIRYDHLARYIFAGETIRNIKKRSLSILDVFTGTGYGAFHLGNSLKGTVVVYGIDGSKEAIDFANEHYTLPNIFFCYKLFPFVLPTQAYDAITCFESLEHVEDDDSLLEEIIKSIKPSGLLFISTPNEAIQSLDNNPNKFHIRHYLHKHAIEKITQKGMDLLSWYGQNVYTFVDGYTQGTLLSNQEMDLKKDVEGQFNIYLFQKISKKFAG